MATNSAVLLPQSTRPQAVSANARYRAAFGLLIAAGLPLGLFGLANLAAEAVGLMPLFFAPFGLPGWLGAVAHLAMLPLLGAAGWIATRKGDISLHLWLGALMAGVIAVPFITAPLDSLQMSIVSVGLFLLTLATIQRVGKASRTAGWLLVPVLGWLGLSAALGMVLAAAWTPPFALTQGMDNAPPAAG